MSDFGHDTRDLLVRGVAAAKAKEVAEASFYLKWLLRLNPTEEERVEACYWLSEVSADPSEARGYLEDILATDPGEPRARRKLAILDGRLDPAEIVDPDHLPQPAPGKTDRPEIDRFTCPQCGGRMTFTPDGQSLTCEYCASRQRLGLSQAAEIGVKKGVNEDDFVVALATAKGHLPPTTLHTFNCPVCGAGYILPADKLTVTCAYCQSSYALKETECQELIAPDGLIPYGITQAEGQQNLKAWLDSLPGNMPVTEAPLQGLYLPLWSFSVDGQITWRGSKYQQGVSLPVTGVVPVMYGNILVLATRRLPEVLRPDIYHFDLSLLTPFDDRYLANTIAETYQMPVADASLEARQWVVNEKKKLVLEGPASSLRDLLLNSSEVEIEAFRLILVPVWLTHYTVDGHRFEVLINGQSGEIYGERPQTGVRRWINRFV